MTRHHGTVSSALCPHRLAPSTCEICRVLEPAPALSPTGRRPAASAGRGALHLPATVAALAVAAIVAFMVVGWVVAAVWAVLRILQLVVVAAVAGWVGWRLGVRHGRRGD